jgi:nucleoside-diphosphate-sugar epimerase
MKVFITGGSGWVGSAVVPELVAAGHDVVGLARSDSSAQVLEGRGAAVVRGDLGDLDVLRGAAAAADGVVHLAFGHDFADMAAAAAVDARTIGALGDALKGSGKPLVITSGTPFAPGRVATEADKSAPVGPGAAREANSDLALALAREGVRVCVVRLPRSVHGHGDSHGFVARLIQLAAERGVSGYVADGSARWPAVHVRDAGRLFRLALVSAPAGSVLHAVGDEGVPFLEISAAIARNLGVDSRPVDAGSLGFLGLLASIDQPASARRTRDLLGWETQHPGLIADIDAGAYAH